MYELLALECAMESSESILMEDVWGTNLSATVFVEKIVATIRSICASMVDYAKTLQLDISKAMSTVKLKHAVKNMRNKVAAGGTVYIPDIKGITNTYRGIAKELRSEMQSIARELSKFRFNESRRIDAYITRKDAFEDRLNNLLTELDDALKKRIEVTSSNAHEIDKYTAQVIKETELYITEYTKLIRDIEKASIDFERLTKKAEISYEFRQATKSNLGRIERVRNSATKLLRRSVFSICALIA